jgi:long-chain acyl-CoA synthetase
MFELLKEENAGKALVEAWRARTSFILVPEKRATADLAAWLSSIPSSLAHGHFGIFTSGSTGQPKLVIGSADRAEALSRLLHSEQDNEPCLSTVCVLPLSYSFAFVNQWVWSRVHDRRFVMTPGFANPEAMFAAFSSSDASMVCMVGAQIPLLRTLVTAETQFPKVLRIHFAGGRFPQAELAFVQQIFPNAVVFNNYGCAEAMPRLSLRRAHASSDASNVGWPLPGVEINITADHSLQFRSPFSSVGFVENNCFVPVAVDSFTATGDRAERNDDGSIRLLGRTVGIIKRYGEKLAVDLLAQKLGEAASLTAVSYIETDSQGELGYVVVLVSDVDTETRQRVLAALRTLSRSQWPLRIESCLRLPVTENGKVDLAQLRKEPMTAIWTQRI